MEDSSEKGFSKSRQRNVKQQQDRSALIDITNDSPIVGLAMASLETPSSAIAKQKSSRAKNTPGSGEALLRGQVKTLLQRVEEEAEHSKLSLESRPFLHLQAFVNSPSGLLAPTPANTPHLSNLSADNSGLASTLPSPIVEELLISQVGLICLDCTDFNCVILLYLYFIAFYVFDNITLGFLLCLDDLFSYTNLEFVTDLSI